MTDQQQISVYIVDDHELVREGLRSLVESAGYEVVGEAGTVALAVEGIVASRPSVAINDVRLSLGSGVEVCRRVRLHSPETVRLMLTSYDDDEAVFASIEAGASAYLLKEIRNLELIEAIGRVVRGERLLDSVATARVLDRLRFGRPHDPRLDGLSISDRVALRLLGEGLSNREIAERMRLSEKTIKNCVKHVLSALGPRSRTQAALFITADPRLAGSLLAPVLTVPLVGPTA